MQMDPRRMNPGFGDMLEQGVGGMGPGGPPMQLPPQLIPQMQPGSSPQAALQGGLGNLDPKVLAMIQALIGQRGGMPGM